LTSRIDRRLQPVIIFDKHQNIKEIVALAMELALPKKSARLY
jgi:hypothetical protein